MCKKIRTDIKYSGPTTAERIRSALARATYSSSFYILLTIRHQKKTRPNLNEPEVCVFCVKWLNWIGRRFLDGW